MTESSPYPSQSVTAGPAAAIRRPHVSVVIPAFNAEKFLERAVVSVQDQSEQDLEIIIVDDCSVDGTVALGHALAARDPRISVITSDVNCGPSRARNLGIAAARGTWVAILDADDIYRRERLETLIRLGEQESLDMVADDIVYYDDVAGKETGRGGVSDGGGSQHLELDLDAYLEASMFRRKITDLSERPYLQLSLLKFVFRRSFLIGKNLVYPEAYRDNEDFLFYAECLVEGARAALLPSAFYMYTQRLGQLSKRRSSMTRTSVNRLRVVDGVNDLLSRHHDRLTPAQRRLLIRRRTQVQGVIAFEQAFDLARRRNFGRAAMRVMRAPASWSFAFQAVVQKARRSLPRR